MERDWRTHFVLPSFEEQSQVFSAKILSITVL
jgi:hypothetical protein